MTWTSWIDRQIEDALKGAFEHLLHGKPIVDPKAMIQIGGLRKGEAGKLDLTPETILARKAVEDWMSIFLIYPVKPEFVGRRRRSINKLLRPNDPPRPAPQKQLDIVLCAQWRAHNQV